MAENAADGVWRNCNICKQGIAFGAEYYLCNVSTCNRKRMGLFFCSLGCFEAHVPMERHRDAWAELERAPTRAAWEASQRAEQNTETAASTPGSSTPGSSTGRGVQLPAGARPVPTTAAARPVARGGTARIVSPAPEQASEEAVEVLVVVSKLKKYVKDWSGMNTSDSAMPVLSDHLRELCREATRQAGLEGRRTVLDRDFAKVLEQRRAGNR
jgi:hypothetical protein